jgi:hypothetical protein
MYSATVIESAPNTAPVDKRVRYILYNESLQNPISRWDGSIRRAMDLLRPLQGRRRRIERIYPGRSSGPIEEWRLRWDISRFHEAIDRAPDMADRLLKSCLNDGPLGRVVFLTEQHFVQCKGPESKFSGISEFDEMLVELTIRTHNNEGSRQYGLFLDGPNDPVVLRCMLKVAALATCFSSVDVRLIEVEDAIPTGIVPAMQDFVSMARSRRTVLPCFRVWPEMARALAFHCHPCVELDLYLDFWIDGASTLADAIRAHRCPPRLALHRILPEAADLLATAFEATSRIEELTLHLQGYSIRKRLFASIGRNRSIRALVVKGEGTLWCSDVTLLWKSVLESATIQSIDARNLVREDDALTFSSSDRRTCARAVAGAIRSNPHLTRFVYDPRIHDAHIMESRVVPVLLFNRFRPVVEALFDGSTGGGGGVGRERTASALLGSPLVRRHPELLHLLVKATRESLVPASGLGRRRRTTC